jgi:hypothetical protein
MGAVHGNVGFGKVRHFLNNLTATTAWGNGFRPFANMSGQAASDRNLADRLQLAITISFRNGDGFGA